MIPRSSRIALHMAGATTTGLPRVHPTARILPLWRWWMSAALLLLGSAIVADAVVWILRQGLR